MDGVVCLKMHSTECIYWFDGGSNLWTWARHRNTDRINDTNANDGKRKQNGECSRLVCSHKTSTITRPYPGHTAIHFEFHLFSFFSSSFHYNRLSCYTVGAREGKQFENNKKTVSFFGMSSRSFAFGNKKRKKKKTDSNKSEHIIFKCRALGRRQFTSETGLLFFLHSFEFFVLPTATHAFSAPIPSWLII